MVDMTVLPGVDAFGTSTLRTERPGIWAPHQESLSWVDGGVKMASDEPVVSADKKVINCAFNPAFLFGSPLAAPQLSENFTLLTPAADLIDVHHVPDSGFVMTANEGVQMTTYYIPTWAGPSLVLLRRVGEHHQ